MVRTAKGASLFLGAVISLYLALTWFFFGTPHPCGIVVALARYEDSRITEEDRAKIEKTVDEARLLWLEVKEEINRTVKLAARAGIEGRTKDKIALLETMSRLREKQVTIEALMEVLISPTMGLEENMKERSPAQCTSTAIRQIKRIWFSGDKQNPGQSSPLS